MRAPVLAQAVSPTLPAKVPSFKIEAVSLGALDETGYDYWPWSDEIRVGFVTPFEDITSRLFGDVDAGETRKFNADPGRVVPVGQATGSATGAGSSAARLRRRRSRRGRRVRASDTL